MVQAFQNAASFPKWLNFKEVMAKFFLTCIKSRSLENLGVGLGMPGLHSMFKRQLQK